MAYPPPLARSLLALTCTLTVSAIPALSSAQPASAQPASAEPASAQPAPPPARDAPSPPPTADVLSNVRRPWLYAADPTTPPQAHVVTSLSVGYTALDRDGARPFAGNVANAGAVFAAAAEVGIFRFVSLRAEGILEGQGSKVTAGAMIGPNFSLLPSRFPVSLGVSGGYLRELGGANGIWARAAIAADLGKARFILNAFGEHVFAPTKGGVEEKRDEIDLILTAGATYALTEVLHLGTEYVVQDLEGAWDPEEAEGGIRHFIGPVAAIKLTRHVQITAGPAFGLSKGAPTVLGRVAAMYAF